MLNQTGVKGEKKHHLNLFVVIQIVKELPANFSGKEAKPRAAETATNSCCSTWLQDVAAGRLMLALCILNSSSSVVRDNLQQEL